jgi:hypothetical protein
MAILSGNQFRKKDYGYSLSKGGGWKASKSVRYTLRSKKMATPKQLYKRYKAK